MNSNRQSQSIVIQLIIMVTSGELLTVRGMREPSGVLEDFYVDLSGG